MFYYIKKTKILESRPVYGRNIKYKKDAQRVYVKKPTGYNNNGTKTILSQKKMVLKKIRYNFSENLIKNNLGILLGFTKNFAKGRAFGLYKLTNKMWFHYYLPSSLTIGDFLQFNLSVDILNKNSVKIAYLVDFLRFQQVSCIKNLHTNKVISSAPGSSSVIYVIYKDQGKVIIKTPSKKFKIISDSLNTTAINSKTSDIKFTSKITAGSSYKAGKKPIVRGCVKNPNDHPHGGRTRSQKQYKNPWGRLIKH